MQELKAIRTRVSLPVVLSSCSCSHSTNSTSLGSPVYWSYHFSLFVKLCSLISSLSRLDLLKNTFLENLNNAFYFVFWQIPTGMTVLLLWMVLGLEQKISHIESFDFMVCCCSQPLGNQEFHSLSPLLPSLYSFGKMNKQTKIKTQNKNPAWLNPTIFYFEHLNGVGITNTNGMTSPTINLCS